MQGKFPGPRCIHLPAHTVAFISKWAKETVITDSKLIFIEFPQTDEKGQDMIVPVVLNAGENTITFGRLSGDWGYMFIKSIEVTAE